MSLIIDALNIRIGGGAVLLNYFVLELQKNEIEFTLLTNDFVKLSDELEEKSIRRFELKNYFNRNQILKKYLTPDKNILFCFGNFPPSFRMKGVKVYTFFQNYILLPNYESSNETIKEKAGLIIRRLYTRLFLKNTDFFIFQTKNISEKFVEAYKISSSRCITIPFFDENKIIAIKKVCESQELKVNKNDFIYVSHPSPHKNINLLLEAWGILLAKNIKPKLFLTIPDYNIEYYHQLRHKIENLNNQGGRIVNLESLSYEEVLKKTYQCGYAIYPSLSESFGLGLIESYYMGLKVIASDLPYVHAVIAPSYIFEPNSAQSIVDAVEKTMSINLPQPKLLVKNQINDLIQLLAS